jgi:hypothetical protein
MHQRLGIWKRETERWERGTPAPELDELEPKAMAMGNGVSMVSEGGGWMELPVGLTPNLDW